MHLSQPAISQALRDLEGQLGLTLFVRGGRLMRPTAEALALLSEVELLSARVGSLMARVTELRDRQAGQLAVATIPVLATGPLPLVIAKFLQQRPKARISLLSFTTSETVDLVKQERADIGFILSPVLESGIELTPLLETHLCCIMKEDSPLARAPAISAAEIGRGQLVALSPDIPPGMLLRQALAKDAFDGSALVETNSATAAIALVQAGLDLAILDPLALLSMPLPGLIARPFEPSIPLTFSIVHSRHRDLSKIAMQFSEMFRAELREQIKILRQCGISATTF
jgi:DNA-binding transcriptional LysR family regulator